jgi:predicted GIY-YIG superfamily endonuclease
MHYFYVLQSGDELYFGSTNDLRRRIFDHNHNRSFSTKHHQWKLVYYEAYADEHDARRREQQMKYHGQAKRWLKGRIKNSLRQR